MEIYSLQILLFSQNRSSELFIKLSQPAPIHILYIKSNLGVGINKMTVNIKLEPALYRKVDAHFLHL